MRILIGYDDREPIGYHVLSHSILARASAPLTITPLHLRNLRGILTRERDPKQSTSFAYSRFLCSYLSGYRGLSLFMDSDMLCRCDIWELADEVRRQPDCALWCCQHDYTPSSAVKFLNQPQSVYPRKNWSSFMLLSNSQCEALTPEYVNTASGLDLHRFNWLTPGAKIGSLPLSYNHLVGEYAPNPAAKVVHFTNGLPCFPGYEDCEFAAEWWAEAREAMSPAALQVPPAPAPFC